MKVEENCRVVLNYEIRLKDNQLIEKNLEDQPLEFTTGRNQVLPALERGIMGMEPGEEKTFEVGPEEAFGHRDPEAVRVVRREDLVNYGNDLEEGLIFRVKDEDGNDIIITVVSMDDEEVVLDLNHPLAGSTLVFNVKILEVEAAC